MKLGKQQHSSLFQSNNECIMTIITLINLLRIFAYGKVEKNTAFLEKLSIYNEYALLFCF